MKLLIKVTFTLMLLCVTCFYAMAFNDNIEPTQPIDNSFINSWADSALTFTVLKKEYDLEALGFSISKDNITSLNTSTDSAFKTQLTTPLFNNGKFIAESAYIRETSTKTDEPVFFLHGSYSVLEQEKFSLLITAKIESLNERSIYQFYSNDFVARESIFTKVKGSTSYTRLAILGQYSLSEHWYLTGGLTSTLHDESSNVQSIYNKKTEQVALIGTTYTF